MFNTHIASLNEKTPYLVIESEKVLHALDTFQRLFGKNAFYAVKANPDKSLVKLLSEHGGNFEVSSSGELDLMRDLGVPAEKIISAGTIKTAGFIKSAFEYGIRYFTADCASEIESIARCAPGSKLIVRLAVVNTGSEWPLERKFGVNVGEAVKLLQKARASGLMPWGLSFHVGSQCTLPGTWLDAIDTARSAWDLAAKKDIHLKSLNLGGGFPVEYRKSVPETEEFARVIFKGLKEKMPDAEDILVEPGRAIAGHAGTIVTTVIAKAMRNRKRWLYLDVGIFNGLMESIGGIKYPFVVERQGEPVKWILAGPSCDGLDVIDKEVYLPDVEIGDRVLILSAGAYTTAYASTFGGAPIPRIYIL